MFKACMNKGFTITFDNGWTASVQWGAGNYCQNRDLYYDYKDTSEQSSLTAEVAAWDSKGCWFVFHEYIDEEDGEVLGQECCKGWLKPNEVLAFLNEIASKEMELVD